MANERRASISIGSKKLPFWASNIARSWGVALRYLLLVTLKSREVSKVGAKLLINLLYNLGLRRLLIVWFSPRAYCLIASTVILGITSLAILYIL